jgi:hypothetical protein
MKRLSLALVIAVASVASAQDPLSAAKKKATDAKKAADAHTEALQKPEAQAPAPKAQAPSPMGVRGPAGMAAATLPPSPAKRGTLLAGAWSATAGPPPTIYREVFEYASEGRRDPFVSLLTTNELRPTLSDIRLTGILFDHTGRNSIATFRDLTNGAQYRVTIGSVLGRMRVTAIHTQNVIFTIDEYGTTRKDSIALKDSTKVRR